MLCVLHPVYHVVMQHACDSACLASGTILKVDSNPLPVLVGSENKMEETKPLDTRSLTHTSKETEGQVWAQIGTSSYDPPINRTQEEKAELNGDSSSTEVPDLSQEQEETALNHEEGSDLELHVDVNAEPNETEEMERGVESKKNETKKPILDDGFATIDTTGTDPIEEEEEEEERKSRKRVSHSRSRSRERIYHPTDRTNSSDPRAVRSRVFVGHLNMEKCTRNDLDKLFAPYGKISGVNLQKGYGFVQYEDEDDVRKAIKGLHGNVLHGNQIGKCAGSYQIHMAGLGSMRP